MLHVRVPLRDPRACEKRRSPLHRRQSGAPVNKGVICAKGSSGIMKQYSPARLTMPLMRRPGAERGAGEFVAISWDEAFKLLEERLARIRATDPKKFAMFTGRDQMQALTGLFARQFGTPNYAAHGGFCSVNMAAGMIYTIGGSFWEFGGPDLERAQALRDDRHRRGPSLESAEDRDLEVQARRRTLHLDQPDPHRLLGDRRRMDADPAGHRRRALPRADPRADRARPLRSRIPRALHERRAAREPGCATPTTSACSSAAKRCRPIPTARPSTIARRCGGTATRTAPSPSHTDGADPFLYGEFALPDGRDVKPAFQLLKERVAECTPEWAAGITGIPANTIRRLARELGVTARDGRIELPIAWTDSWGREHATVTGNPVAFHAMRGLAAHSNGFQTIRALAILMSLLGTIDRPGGFRHKSPFPRMVPPSAKPPNRPRRHASPTRRSADSCSAGPARRTISSSTTTASRCASTRRSRGSIRSPCTG